MSITRFIFSVLAFIGFAAFSILPKLLAAPAPVAIVSGVTAFLCGLAFVLLIRPVLLTATRNLAASGQVRPGIFVLLLMSLAIGINAASNIENSITSLVIRPSGTRLSDTNGLIRLYSANESNYFAITTNLDFVFFTPNGAFTGRTHSQIFTNINDTSSRSTSSWKSGILVGTNGVIAQ